MTDEEIKKLKEDVHTWKEASSANSYKAFQLQEENKMLSKHILELQKDKGELTDRCKDLEAQIEKMQCCEMCKHKNLNWGFSPICEARNQIKIENPLTCKCDKWEIKEK